ncbi:wound-induced proteinase inhibitor 1-like [Lycium ferocissimum]|uniref:wound-induced proteinase inhibitor 1-like n=1 Tax=Lycium ferocissimum TaxID=112874 RepID=UPI002815EFC8|nr:wound-induced proteinase inhibitor 1-like [Lycium ferocissimum]
MNFFDAIQWSQKLGSSLLTYVIAFLLLATSFETLMARKERATISDGLEVIQLLNELKSVEGFDESNLVCKGKHMWPELIGVPAKLAKERIEKEISSVKEVQIILNGSPAPLDFRCGRVRLAVNILNVVVQIPAVR